MPKPARRTPGSYPFRRAVLGGLGVVAPPLLTVLIFLWVGNSVQQYMLRPVINTVREAMVWAIGDIRTEIPGAKSGEALAWADGRQYIRMDDEHYVPLHVYDAVRKSPSGADTLPRTAQGVYREYVEMKYLKSYYVVPFFLSIIVLLLYLLGKFMGAGIGRFFWRLIEGAIVRVPIVSGVYSGVKQVSDFMFKEREIEFNRVVAVEYPRKGIWSIGFVTGESVMEIRDAANESVLAVYIPCSPLPLTGYTVNCLKSECLDLNMTFDQACQFMISCGVVVPPHQVVRLASGDQNEPVAAPADPAPPTAH